MRVIVALAEGRCSRQNQRLAALTGSVTRMPGQVKIHDEYGAKPPARMSAGGWRNTLSPFFTNSG